VYDIDRSGILFLKSPVSDTVPLVLDSPHSGTTYPDDFDHVSDFTVLRRAEDTFVHELYDCAPRHGAILMGAHFPRSYVDVNRSLEEIDLSMIDGEWDGPAAQSEKADAGIGLIWRVNQNNENLYSRKLTIQEVRHRIQTYWQAYHNTLRDSLEETHKKFGKYVHINCHSMPEISNESSKEGPGVRRAEFVLGDRHGSTCDPALTQTAKSVLEELGYEVKVNDPYAGVELVKAYSNPTENRHSLQVEIRRDLYMEEATLGKNANFGKLQKDLETLVKALADFSLSL